MKSNELRRHIMNAKLHKFDTAVNQNTAGAPAPADASAVDDREDASAVTSAGSARALRNWLIVANVAAWLLIFFAVRLTFF